MQYARQNNFQPLGIVILAENGDFSDFMDEDAIPRKTWISRNTYFISTRCFGASVCRAHQTRRLRHEGY